LKGQGLFATRDIKKGQAVLEYAGVLMSAEEGYALEKAYEMKV